MIPPDETSASAFEPPRSEPAPCADAAHLRAGHRTRPTSAALTSGLIGGVIGAVMSALANYIVVGLPSSPAANAANHAVSGLISGFLAGFLGLLAFQRKMNRGGKSGAAEILRTDGQSLTAPPEAPAR
ncbi:hypothetical protein [Streptomyces sp. NPDC088812]|uniref:hypothetical protein n=1 Tax=Streptomyces sp. NPDC088812 TaxID=3365905 RepID=UPI003828D91A